MPMLPVDASVEETVGGLLDKEITVEPAKIAQDLKYRDRGPDVQRNQGKPKDMTQQNRSICPVIRNRVHLKRRQKEGRIGHRVGKVENTLPALECVLDGA